MSNQTGPAAAIDNNTVTGMELAITAGFPFNTVSIEVLRISQNTVANCSVTGIIVATAGGVTISDNTIDGSSITGSALSASGSAIDVSGNLVTNLNADKAGEGQPAAGIDIEAPFTSVDVSHNQIQLVSKPSGSLTALLVNGRNSPTTTVCTTDNILNGIGNVPAVSVEGVQDLHFAGNNVMAANQPAVTLQETSLDHVTVRCLGNVVRAAVPAQGGTTTVASIEISGINPDLDAFAVLGNITSYQILVNNHQLGDPWSPLNVVMTH